MVTNGLDELLTCLAEEGAEIGQVACKALRFGIHDHHPVHGTTNGAMLTQEVGDLLAVVDRLVGVGALSWREINAARSAKDRKLGVWLRQPPAHHVNCATLDGKRGECTCNTPAAQESGDA